MASVTMKGCSRPPTMTMPLIAPTISPTQGSPAAPEHAELGLDLRQEEPERARHAASPTAAGSTTRAAGRGASNRRSPRPPPVRRWRSGKRVERRQDDEDGERQRRECPSPRRASSPGTVRSMAQTTEQSAMIEPTERSMPAVRITAVIPVAMRPVMTPGAARREGCRRTGRCCCPWS